MKIKLQHILILASFTFFAKGVNTYAQGAGTLELEQEDNPRADRFIYSPGESGEIRYTPRRTGVPPKDSITDKVTTATEKATTILIPPTKLTKPEKADQTVKPVDKQQQSPQGKSPEDSILTFNFLYYIIQKYKLQDIID